MEHFPKLSHLQSFPAPSQELVADGVARARAAAANSHISWGQMEEGDMGSSMEKIVQLKEG